MSLDALRSAEKSQRRHEYAFDLAALAQRPGQQHHIDPGTIHSTRRRARSVLALRVCAVSSQAQTLMVLAWPRPVRACASRGY